MFKTLFATCALLVAFATPVQAAEQMVPSANQSPTPSPGKALVVFMRPSFYGGAIAASVFDAPDGADTFIGIVRPKQKVAYEVDPGAHRFMVVAENADFLEANLDAGKTYYVLVSPRPGVWKARFSLLPLRNDDGREYTVRTPDFAKWVAATTYVERAQAADAWYADNKASIEAKKADYLVKWTRMLPADKAELTLRAEDGVAASAAGAAPEAAVAVPVEG